MMEEFNSGEGQERAYSEGEEDGQSREKDNHPQIPLSHLSLNIYLANYMISPKSKLISSLCVEGNNSGEETRRDTRETASRFGYQDDGGR
jgi:hypothetical protein